MDEHSLFISPNLSSSPARFPSQLMVSLAVMISSAWHLSVPSTAREPLWALREGRLWPWSNHWNKSVIFVSMETYIWLLSQADSQVSLPVMFLYFISLLTIVKTFYSHAHLFWRNSAAASTCLLVLAGVGSALIEFANLPLADSHSPSHRAHTIQLLPSHLTQPGKTPSILLPGLSKIFQDIETLYFLIFNNCRLLIFNFKCYRSFWLMSFFSAFYIGIFSSQIPYPKSWVSLWKSLDIPTKIRSNNQELNTSIHLLPVSLKIYTNISLIFLFAIVSNVSREIFSHIIPYLMVTLLK